MKKPMTQMTGFADAATSWLTAAAGLPATLVDGQAQAGEWLGWDAWVTVPDDCAGGQ